MREQQRKNQKLTEPGGDLPSQKLGKSLKGQSKSKAAGNQGITIEAVP